MSFVLTSPTFPNHLSFTQSVQHTLTEKGWLKIEHSTFSLRLALLYHIGEVKDKIMVNN